MATLGTQFADHAAVRERALRSLNDLPPFSPVLNRLLAMLGKEDVSVNDMASVIERDTVLAGNVLRLVNSGLYGRRATITSVACAISLLGLTRLRNVALGMSVSRIWQKLRFARGFSLVRFNHHSLAVALLADGIATRVPVEFSEGAFVAGLFHDLGRLLMATSLSEEYEAIERIIAGAEDRSAQARDHIEREILGITHAELSASALTKWNLPPPVIAAVTSHHHPGRARDGKVPLALAVQVADEMADQLSAGVSEYEDRGGDPDLALLTSVGVQNPDTFIGQFRTEYDSMRAVA